MFKVVAIRVRVVKGTTKDAGKAFELYKKASDLGAAPGHYALSRAYSAGVGVEKNLSEAGTLLRKAADMGHEAAQVTLGAQYMQGSSGMSKNQEEALVWFKKAAEKNYPSALYQLGAAYESGAGVGMDIGTARDYYTKAAKGGLKDADVALSRLKSQEDTQRASDRASSDKTDAQQCDRYACRLERVVADYQRKRLATALGASHDLLVPVHPD